MDNSEIVVHEGGGMTFSGDGVRLYQAIALRSGLMMYAKCRMKPNRAWTPTAMLRAVEAILPGKHYRRGEYDRAAADLTFWINEMRDAIPISHS